MGVSVLVGMLNATIGEATWPAGVQTTSQHGDNATLLPPSPYPSASHKAATATWHLCCGRDLILSDTHTYTHTYIFTDSHTRETRDFSIPHWRLMVKLSCRPRHVRCRSIHFHHVYVWKDLLIILSSCFLNVWEACPFCETRLIWKVKGTQCRELELSLMCLTLVLMFLSERLEMN